MKKILKSLIVITTLAFVAIGASRAYFSDTETSTDNTFVAGAFDLLINGQNDPISIVNIQDLKPGDDYFINKDLFIQNDAYVWMHIKDIISQQGEQTEPEELEENGVPRFDLENYLTYDLSFLDDPENPLVTFDDDNTLWEMHSCWIPLGIIPGGQTTTITQSFHFPEDITNWAQGDFTTFTEEFYAEQVRNNETPEPPDTGSGRVWDAIERHCINCVEGETFASLVVASDQGNRKNGTDVLANRSNPDNALGAPDTTDLNDPKWFSLGFGGSITLKFTFPVDNGAGADLSFHEITGGRPTYPTESAQVEVSQDGANWEVLGVVTSEPGGGGDGIVLLDLDSTSFDWVQYVRITDTTNPAIHTNDADGYDLDAVDAVYGTCRQAIIVEVE